MGKYYPCDGADGYCPYEDANNGGMWFCYNMCGVGACDEDNRPEEYEEPPLEWVSMSRMIEWGIDYELADYLTAMGQPQIQHDTETDEIYCEGEFAYSSVKEFVEYANTHRDEFLEGV